MILTLILAACFTIMAGTGTHANLCEYAVGKMGIEKGLSIPSYIPYQNDVLSFYTGNGTSLGFLRTADGAVDDFSCNNTVDNYTYRIYVKDQETIDALLEASSPADTMTQLMDQQAIRIEAKSLTKRIKAFFTRTALRIWSWFS